MINDHVLLWNYIKLFNEWIFRLLNPRKNKRSLNLN